MLLALAWAGATLWLFSDGATTTYGDMVVLYLGAAFVGTAALVTLIAGSASSARAGGTGRKRWLPLVLTLLLVALVPSLCRYALPFRARFALSEAALLAAARGESPSSEGPTWIGWLAVRHIDEAGGATRFTTGTCGLSARCGVAHAPDGRPQPTEGASYQPLRGPWWLFEQK